MKKIVLLPLLLVGALLAQGCAELSESFAGPLGVIGPSRVDRNCPAPSETQLNNGNLKLEDGVTLKCQVNTNTAADISAAVAIPIAAPFALSDLISPELLQIIFAVGR